MRENFVALLREPRLLLLGGSVTGAIGLVAWKLYGRNTTNKLPSPPLKDEIDRKTFTKKDWVYLCIPPRLGAVPNISPFCVKLETWLRMESIPYQVIETTIPSTSEQTYPYIYLNGEETSDSRFIIERCAHHFGKTLDSNLSAMDQALSVAYSRMVEEQLGWIYAWHRYILGADKYWANFLPPERLNSLGKYMLGMKEPAKQFMKERANARGFGRHTNEQIYLIAEEDIQSISTYLGDKDFFMGKEPSVIDCTIFGSLVQLFCLEMDFPPINRRKSEWTNLIDYIERMKSRFYPDWEQLCNPV